MQNSKMRKKLDTIHKLNCRIKPDVYWEFIGLLDALIKEGVKFKASNESRRKLAMEPLLGAILLDFFDHPPDQRLVIARRNIARYDALMESMGGKDPIEEDVTASTEKTIKVVEKKPIVGKPKRRGNVR